MRMHRRGARAAVDSWGKWVGYCTECTETITGPMAAVDLWADVHNETHPEVRNDK